LRRAYKVEGEGGKWKTGNNVEEIIVLYFKIKIQNFPEES